MSFGGGLEPLGRELDATLRELSTRSAIGPIADLDEDDAAVERRAAGGKEKLERTRRSTTGITRPRIWTIPAT